MSRDANVRRRKLTPPEVAKLWGCDAMKIVKLIRKGELRAINGALNTAGRPRYLIDETDLLAFEQRRLVVPPAPDSRSRRKNSATVVEFIR